MFRTAVLLLASASVASSLLARGPVSRQPRIDGVARRAIAEPDAEQFSEVYKATSPRWKKRTKQVATLGPASSTREMIEKLFLAGVDVFRLNFSHGEPEEKQELVEMIRSLEEEYEHPIAILADLQGPKQRVGTFAGGQKFRFGLELDVPGDATRVGMPHPEIIDTLKPGDSLLVDDGKLRMTVTESGAGYVDCHVDIGGDISNRKGVNTPTIVIPISPLTKKDREDLQHALRFGVDWIALSFVQKPEDMVELRTLVGDRAKILAKIEKPQAVDVLDGIVEHSDGIMVARGDLGVEMNPEDVPVIQKQIISTCRDMGKPVIVATQMLESMVTNPTPTRAEASDVATAIYDGADAIMLSGESAAGRFPVESVSMQARIIDRVENDGSYQKMASRDVDALRSRLAGSGDPTDALVLAARGIANDVDASALVSFSMTGTSVLKASQYRPAVPIMAVTPHARTARFLALSWGIYPVITKEDLTTTSIKDAVRSAATASLAKGLASSETDLLVMLAGLPFGTPGVVNFCRVVPASGPDVWAGAVNADASV